MYLRVLKHNLVQAMKEVFDAEYDDERFRNLHIGIEFPMEEQNYPGLWVDFEPGHDIQTTGIGHKEYGEPATDGSRVEYRRWQFDGNATYTIAALSSLERDALYDQMVALIAWGDENPTTNDFLKYLYTEQDLLGLTVNTDTLSTRGFAANPGTPWGSDEIIYEVTLSIEVVGEFVSEGKGLAIVPLSAVILYPYAQGEPDPVPLGEWL